MRVVVFGTGYIFKKYIDEVEADNQVVAILDNNVKTQGEYVKNHEVVSPDRIVYLEYDYVILMSDYAVDMRKQLLGLGVPKDKIIHYKEYVYMPVAGLKEPAGKRMEKKVMIITSSIGYHGGSIVAINLAQALNIKGYFVTIAAPEIDKRIIDEFSSDRIEFQESSNIQFSVEYDKDVINSYDFVIVNTLPMIMCALKISKFRKVMLWLHESNLEYPKIEYWKEEIIKNCENSNLSIYAVSEVAKKCFINNLCQCNIEVLPYAITDAYKACEKKTTELSFAVVGTIYPLKQQLLFLEAIKLINYDKTANCKFYIVGKNMDNSYFDKINKQASEMKNVKVIKEKTRKQLYQLYENIDVFVIPSQEESMSLIATEAMMLEKVCIITPNAGMASFIRNYENGVVLSRCDKYDIAEAMEFCMNNHECLKMMGENARNTYLDFFTLEKLGDRMDDIITSSY